MLERWHNWRLARKVRAAQKVMVGIDAELTRRGKTRRERKQFWRDVVAGRTVAL